MDIGNGCGQDTTTFACGGSFSPEAGTAPLACMLLHIVRTYLFYCTATSDSSALLPPRSAEESRD